MSKILKNDSGSDVTIVDVGNVTITDGTQYTIDPFDYLRFARSSDTVTEVGAGNLVVNDGSSDLSISDGVDLIKGIFPNPVGILGDTDQTTIGNVGDRLKVIGGDEDRARLENGEAFILNIEYVLNNGQTVYHSFKTPNTSTRIFIRYKTYSADRTQMVVFENPTGATYSFPWTARNRNRELNTASTATIQAVSGQTTVGTFFYKDSNYGSGLSVTQSPIQFSEWMALDQDTEYFFGMTSFAASNLTTLQLQWYEVP